MEAGSEAEGDQYIARNSSERSDGASDSQSHHRKNRRNIFREVTASGPRAHDWNLTSQQTEDRQRANDQRAMRPRDLEAQTLGLSVGASNSRQGNTQAEGGRLRIFAPKRKKRKYDPEPMKAVAEHAQDILAPISQTNVPAAASSCVVLNCKSSAPIR